VLEFEKLLGMGSKTTDTVTHMASKNNRAAGEASPQRQSLAQKNNRLTTKKKQSIDD
jgi:hypothetical protein